MEGLQVKCPVCGNTPVVKKTPITDMFSASCRVEFDHWIAVYADTGWEAVQKWQNTFDKKPSWLQFFWRSR
jgi:hypothetical protein